MLAIGYFNKKKKKPVQVNTSKLEFLTLYPVQCQQQCWNRVCLSFENNKKAYTSMTMQTVVNMYTIYIV